MREAIQSILDQTFSDFELLILDDGSIDNSAEIIQSFNDPRIRIHKNEKNLGLIGTLNVGLSLSKGTYIARMDSDDISAPDRFAKQVDFLDTNPLFVVVGSNCEAFGKESAFSSVPLSDEDIRLTMYFENPFIHPSVMFRKDVVEQNRIQYDKDFIHIEDWAFWRELLRHGKGKNLSEPLLKYRISDSNISILNRPSAKQRYMNFYKLILSETGVEGSEENAKLQFQLSFFCKDDYSKLDEISRYAIALKTKLKLSGFSKTSVELFFRKKMRKISYVVADRSLFTAIKFGYRHNVLTLSLVLYALKTKWSKKS